MHGECSRGPQGGIWGATGGICEEKRLRGILGGWGWRHMQLVGMRGCGIITPDQESGTRVGLHKVTVNSSRVAQGMLVLGRGNCTTPLCIFCHKNTSSRVSQALVCLGLVW